MALAGCGGQASSAPDPARRVVTAPVLRDEAVDQLVLLGDVQGSVEVQVFAQLPERIRTLHVHEGDTVSAGDPIATLEAALPSSDVAQAAAALAAAEASRDQLTLELDRVRGLVARAALPANQLEGLEAQVRAADAQVAQLQATQRGASLRRDQTVVRAPVDGIVAMLSVSAGDMVVPARPLCAVVQMDRVEIELTPVEPDWVRLEEGMAVEVRPTALPEVERDGVLVERSPVIDRLTRTGKATVSIDNPEHVLRPGMVAEVEIVLRRRENVLFVPGEAVRLTTTTEEDQRAVVFVADSGRAARREVRLGRRYGARIEIVDGLEEGERVVVRGQHLLRDGTAIRTVAADRAVADRDGADQDAADRDGADRDGADRDGAPER